jgi:hypothetical protein
MDVVRHAQVGVDARGAVDAAVRLMDRADALSHASVSACSLGAFAIAARDARTRRESAVADGAAGTGFGLAFARYDELLKGVSTLTLLGLAQYGTLKRQG